MFCDMSDTTKTIFQSAKHFFSGTVLSRVTGMARDMVMAFAFGTQGPVAALLVAFRFSHLLRRVLGEGALQTAFIPNFEGLKKEEPRRAYQFFLDLAVCLSSLLGVIVLVVSGFLFWISNYGNYSSETQDIAFLTLIMMPSLFFICLYGLNAALLQCEKSYFIPGVAPVVFNLVWISGTLCVSGLASSSAMPWLAGFIVVACAGQWAFTLPKTYAILRENGFLSPWKDGRLFSLDVKSLIKPLGLSVLGICASQINNALDAVFALFADSEGPAYLWYAMRFQQLPIGLFGVALSGALLPPLARAIKDRDFSRYSHFLDFAMSRSVMLMLPITVGLICAGDACINLVYGRGDFTSESTLMTTVCLWAYSLGIIPTAFVLIIAPAFYSRQDYRTPTLFSLVSVGLNIVLNALMVAVFGLGAASIALSTSVSAWVNFILLYGALHRDREIEIRGPMLWVNEFWRSLFFSAVGALAVFSFDAYFYEGNFFLGYLSGEQVLLPRQLVPQLVRCVVEGSLFAAPVVGYWVYRSKTSKKELSPSTR